MGISGVQLVKSVQIFQNQTNSELYSGTLELKAKEALPRVVVDTAPAEEAADRAMGSKMPLHRSRLPLHCCAVWSPELSFIAYGS